MMKDAEDDILMVTKLVELLAFTFLNIPPLCLLGFGWLFLHVKASAAFRFPPFCLLLLSIRLWGLKPWIVDWDCDWDLEGVSHDSPFLLYNDSYDNWFGFSIHLVKKWQVINHPLCTDVFPDPLCKV